VLRQGRQYRSAVQSCPSGINAESMAQFLKGYRAFAAMMYLFVFLLVIHHHFQSFHYD
jgi:hypothetical protein